MALIAALPLVAYGARAKRDALRGASPPKPCSRRAKRSKGARPPARRGRRVRGGEQAVRLTATRTSRTVDAVVDKASARSNATSPCWEAASPSRGERVEVARATDALSRDVRSASASALRAAKESGSVAGMLAKDVAASRVDAREAFDLLAGLLAESAEETERRDGETKDEVAFELGVLAETVGNLEKSLAKLSAENDDDVVASVSVSSENDESATRFFELTAQSLEALRARRARAAASAAEPQRRRRKPSSASSVRNDDAYDDAATPRRSRPVPTPVVASWTPSSGRCWARA